VVTLNVGGRLFTTTRTTLTSESDSVLGRMFDPTSSLPPARMVDGAFFIDANPKVFEVILDFLRHRCILLPPSLPLEAVLAQARYFGLESLLAGEGELGAEARVRINAGGAIFETTRATLTGQPDSHLAKLLSKGEQELFLDVCPKAFEVLLCFLRCGARKIPPGSAVCAESIGDAAQSLGVKICLESKRGPGFCKIVWTDERKEKPRFINCKMLGLKGHKNAPTSDDWLLDD